MKNPLLVPELREMLKHENIEEIQYFSSSNIPSVVADFLGALEYTEIVTFLSLTESETAADIFVSFEEEIQENIINLFDLKILSKIIYYMNEDDMDLFLAKFDAEKKRVIESYFPLYEVEEEKLKEEKEHEEEEKTDIKEPEENFILDEEGDPYDNIDVYKTTDEDIIKLGKFENDIWINLIDPDEEEIEYLSKNFNVPLDFLTASLDIDERSRIEIEGDAVLIIIKVPLFDEDNKDLLYSTVAMGIILTPNNIITVSSKENAVIADFLTGKVKNFSTKNRDKFILQIFLQTTLIYLQYLKQINNITNLMQKKIQEASKNQQLIKLLNLEKSLVYFMASLKSNELIIGRLQHVASIKIDFKNEENLSIYEDIVIECKQAIEMANIYSNILNVLMNSFAAIISNNLNTVMRLLTTVTLILTFPMIITSFYGMNVNLPFQQSSFVLFFILAVTLIPVSIAIVIFKKRNWF